MNDDWNSAKKGQIALIPRLLQTYAPREWDGYIWALEGVQMGSRGSPNEEGEGGRGGTGAHCAFINIVQLNNVNRLARCVEPAGK